MAGYTKLFGSILHSTVWHTPGYVRLVWITMLAMCDRDGLVEASVPGLAIAARVERSECEEALRIFLAPDPDSRTKDHEGRRIEEVDGGWLILNAASYRERQSKEEQNEKSRIRMERKRLRDAAKTKILARIDEATASDVTPVVTQSDAQSRLVTDGNASSREVRQAEAEADAKADANLSSLEEREIRASERETAAVVTLLRSSLRGVGIVPSDLTSGKWDIIADWVIEFVLINHGRSINEVCASLARGFKASEKAKAKGYPLPWLARNPMEYLDKVSVAPAYAPGDYEGGSRTLTDDEVFGPKESR